MRVKLLSQNKEKKITAKPAGPRPRCADPLALILWISQRRPYLSIASGHTKTPDRPKEKASDNTTGTDDIIHNIR